MTLINTLLFHSTEVRWEELASELERLNAKKAVTVCTVWGATAVVLLTACIASDVECLGRRACLLHSGLPIEHDPRSLSPQDDTS